MSDFICRIPKERFSEVRLVALDLDGTLFNPNGRITPASIAAINRLQNLGVHVVISTGRPLSGVPFAQLKDTTVDYAITTNGASVYRIHDKFCIFEDALDPDTARTLLEYFLQKDCHIAAFIGGEGISPSKCQAMVPNLILPDSIKETYNGTRLHVDDLIAEIDEKGYLVDKFTLNFQGLPDGTLLNRQDVQDFLMQRDDLEVVCGGFSNLEMTKKGVDKGIGLHKLAEYLGVDPQATMAIGDTENDLPILRAAGLSVAMGNAIDEMKKIADIVTYSNAEDGVAYVLNLIGDAIENE